MFRRISAFQIHNFSLSNLQKIGIVSARNYTQQNEWGRKLRFQSIEESTRRTVLSEGESIGFPRI